MEGCEGRWSEGWRGVMGGGVRGGMRWDEMECEVRWKEECEEGGGAVRGVKGGEVRGVK